VSPPRAPGDAELEFRRSYRASPEEVFRAFTEPDQLRQWFRPPGGSSPSAEVDLRVGGRFRVAMKPALATLATLARLFPGAKDEVAYAVGSFLEIEPPHRLVYTFDWEGLPLLPAGETLVTVEIIDRGGSSEVVLRHERLRAGPHRTFHLIGWRSSLRSLHRVVEPAPADGDPSG
jgi:uncharacterized protein YndB with AHSA1/START domain